MEDDQLASMTTEDITRNSRLLDNEIRILKVRFLLGFPLHSSNSTLFHSISCSLFIVQEEVQRTTLELDSFKEKIKENQEKIKLNKQLPYLVGNIVEVTIYVVW